MGLVRTDKDGNPIVVKRRKTQRGKRVSKNRTKAVYECDKCKDSGTVMNKDSKQIKCSCTIKLEIQNWLDNRLKVVIRRAGTTLLSNLDLSNTKEDIITALYKGVKTNTFLKQIIKHLVEQYFIKGMTTYDYKVMTGNDYTEKYVVGEHRVYHNTEELFVILGQDNFNQTLKTTIYSLITERDLSGKRTWILTPDPKIATGSMNDLYGQIMVDYLKEKDNFDKVYTGGAK